MADDWLAHHRGVETHCTVCGRAAYRLADVPVCARTLKVPLCAECFLLFMAYPSAFKLSRLVGANGDAPQLELAPEGPRRRR
jgi:hypothetical protein